MKKIIIAVMCVIILGIVIYACNNSREERILQDMKASEFDRIEIWMNNEPAVITGAEDIQRFLDVVQSTKIKKRTTPDRAGSILAELYYKNGEQVGMAISSEHINIGEGKYECDKNICDQINKLYEEFK